MRKRSGVLEDIRASIAFIERAQVQAQEIRLQLNHEIMFNLRDTYLAVAKQQTALSLPLLALFLALPPAHPPLQRMVRWNNHGNSLNLSFAEFSAMLVSKEDRLLAKMVLEREEMGAIPNFLLDQVRAILLREVELHEHCMECRFDGEQVREWVETVIDENGDVCQVALDEFMEVGESQNSSSRSQQSSLSPFMRFLHTSGNITGERLLSLWESNTLEAPTLLHDASSKMHKLSTYISITPKSLLSCHSQQQFVRPEFFDCLTRPPAGTTEVREGKSIEKHIYRMNSDKNLRIMAKGEAVSGRQQRLAVRVMATLKEIVQVERQTEDCRIDLRLCPDFYPVLFYDSIPKDRSSRTVTAVNLRDYLESFGYYVEPADTYLLFRRYAPGGRLSFNAFCQVFDTVEREFDLLEKNRYVESLQDVEVTTKRHFFALLLAVMRNQARINQIKVAFLKHSRDLPAALTKMFDSFGRNGQLSDHDFREVFRHYLGVSVPITDIRLIFRRCSQGKPNSDSITKDALLKQLLPSPSPSPSRPAR